MNVKITILMYCILICGCVSQNEESLQHISIEQKALYFFTDSLLHKKQIFKSEKDSIDSNGIIRLPPAIDDFLYEEGLFSNIDLYSGGYAYQLTQPHVDTTDFILTEKYLSQTEKEVVLSLYSDYWNRFSFKDSIKLEYPDDMNIKVMQEVNFETKGIENSLYLNPRKYIKNGDEYYVQLEFRMHDYPMYESYNFYIIFDSTQSVTNWFMK